MKRIIHLNENIFHKLFLVEGKLTTQAKNRSYQVLKNGNSWVAPILDNPCTEDGMDGSMTYFDYVYKEVTDHWCRNNIKLRPVFVNILFNELGFKGPNQKDDKINMFKEIAPLFEKDEKLGSLPWNEAIKYSYEDLYNYFKPIIDKKEQEDSEKINNATYGESDYDIVLLKNFEEAKTFSGYTGGRNGEGYHICYTTGEGTWNGYTNNGKNNVYLCLKHGYENIKPNPRENAPFDEYGLSMIFVIVDGRGHLTTSNVRWNHAFVDKWNRAHGEDRSVDKILSEVEISKITNKNFKKEFKGKDCLSLKEIEEKINEVNSFWKIDKYFDYSYAIGNECYIVKYENGYNILDFKNKRFLFKIWYDKITNVLPIGSGLVNIFKDGFSWVLDIKNSKEVTRKMRGIRFDEVTEDGKLLIARYVDDKNHLTYLFNIEQGSIIRNEGFKDIIGEIKGLVYLENSKEGTYSIVDLETGEKIMEQNYKSLRLIGYRWVMLQSLNNGRYFIFDASNKKLLNENGYNEILANKTYLENGNLFPNHGAKYCSHGNYVYVRIGELIYAQFQDGELCTLSSYDVCGSEGHEKYEEMEKEIHDFIENPPHPYNFKNYLEGLYDYYRNRNQTDGLLEIADDFVRFKFSDTDNPEVKYWLDNTEAKYWLVNTYMEAARMLAIDYHYVFDGWIADEEYEDEHQDD